MLRQLWNIHLECQADSSWYESISQSVKAWARNRNLENNCIGGVLKPRTPFKHCFLMYHTALKPASQTIPDFRLRYYWQDKFLYCGHGMCFLNLKQFPLLWELLTTTLGLVPSSDVCYSCGCGWLIPCPKEKMHKLLLLGLWRIPGSCPF